MKLREVLDMFDVFDTNVIIWKPEDNDDEPVYQGYLSDLPYWLLETEVVGKLYTNKYVNKHDVTFGALVVEVKDVN